MDKQINSKYLDLRSKEVEDNIVRQTIPSETVRKFLQDTNHRFNVYELATLIHNCDANMSMKIFMLNSLATELRLTDGNENDYTEAINIIGKLYTEYLNVQNSLLAIHSNQTAILFEVRSNEYEEVRCIETLDLLKKVVSKDNIELSDSMIRVVDLKTSEVLYYIKLNDDFVPMTFSYGDSTHEEIKEANLWLDIPIKFSIGERVKIHGDKTDTIYVVCYENKLPSEFKGDLDLFDTCITVITEDKLNKERSYKEQIDAIISDRIKNLETKENSDLDIISMYHEHISTLVIEKIEDNT